MKITTLLSFLLLSTSLIAQEKFVTHNGVINFEASVPLFEEIKAVNRKVSIVLEPKTNTFSCVVLIKDFRFRLDLMQQHFNENYLESHRYPKAVFKGKIDKFNYQDINETEKTYSVKGRLYIHGKFKEIEVKVAMRKTADGIVVSSNLPITVADFNIPIPEIVTHKISKTATTSLYGVLKSEDFIFLTLK